MPQLIDLKKWKLESLEQKDPGLYTETVNLATALYKSQRFLRMLNSLDSGAIDAFYARRSSNEWMAEVLMEKTARGRDAAMRELGIHVLYDAFWEGRAIGLVSLQEDAKEALRSIGSFYGNDLRSTQHAFWCRFLTTDKVNADSRECKGIKELHTTVQKELAAWENYPFAPDPTVHADDQERHFWHKVLCLMSSENNKEFMPFIQEHCSFLYTSVEFVDTHANPNIPRVVGDQKEIVKSAR